VPAHHGVQGNQDVGGHDHWACVATVGRDGGRCEASSGAFCQMHRQVASSSSDACVVDVGRASECAKTLESSIVESLSTVDQSCCDGCLESLVRECGHGETPSGT